MEVAQPEYLVLGNPAEISEDDALKARLVNQPNTLLVP